MGELKMKSEDYLSHLLGTLQELREEGVACDLLLTSKVHSHRYLMYIYFKIILKAL